MIVYIELDVFYLKICRFTGTVVGIEEADPKRWQESKWRCLKVVSLLYYVCFFAFIRDSDIKPFSVQVRWDETSTIPRPDRVSPWKIEPALTPPALNPLPVPRPKRPRPNILPSSPDSSVLTREGRWYCYLSDLASGFSELIIINHFKLAFMIVDSFVKDNYGPFTA